MLLVSYLVKRVKQHKFAITELQNIRILSTIISETLRLVYSPLFEWRSHVKRFFWDYWVSGFGEVFLRLGIKRSKKWEKILYTFVRCNLNKQLNKCLQIHFCASSQLCFIFVLSFFLILEVKRMDDMERSLETSLCRFLSHFL